MSDRDQYISNTIIEHMTEAQKEQLFLVISKFDEVRDKLSPLAIAGQELQLLPSVKISFGFSGHLALR